MTEWLSKTDILDCYTRQPEDAKFCPHCLSKLEFAVGEGRWYCPNGACPSQVEYDLGGNLIVEVTP